VGVSQTLQRGVFTRQGGHPVLHWAVELSSSLYLPPSCRWTESDIEDLIVQLPPPIDLLRDFNVHNKDWGCSKNDGKGKMIGDLRMQRNPCLLNDGAATYILASRLCLYSAINLSICDTSLYLDFSWKVHDDLCGSK